MPTLVSLRPVEDADLGVVPILVSNPVYFFGDEFGIPSDIAVVTAIDGAGEDDEVVARLLDENSDEVSRSFAGKFRVLEHNVPGVVVLDLDLRAVPSLGRYTLEVRLNGLLLGSTHVYFDQIQT
ncbi:MAG: hypothetical protein IT462_15025 [Planctomycetes bacterium]|nr:hypothetical protein [Planctomycetota bacterium]